MPKSFTAGYWRSGDIGSMDEDGFVYVFDRKKDMINRGGFKIFSAEVESVLASHPGVVESAIVARPCPVLGERVHAFVTVREPVRFEPGRTAALRAGQTFRLQGPRDFHTDASTHSRAIRTARFSNACCATRCDWSDAGDGNERHQGCRSARRRAQERRQVPLLRRALRDCEPGVRPTRYSANMCGCKWRSAASARWDTRSA